MQSRPLYSAFEDGLVQYMLRTFPPFEAWLARVPVYLAETSTATVFSELGAYLEELSQDPERQALARDILAFVEQLATFDEPEIRRLVQLDLLAQLMPGPRELLKPLMGPLTQALLNDVDRFWVRLRRWQAESWQLTTRFAEPLNDASQRQWRRESTGGRGSADERRRYESQTSDRIGRPDVP